MQRCEQVIWGGQCRFHKGRGRGPLTVAYICYHGCWGEQGREGAWDGDVAPYNQDFLWHRLFPSAPPFFFGITTVLPSSGRNFRLPPTMFVVSRRFFVSVVGAFRGAVCLLGQIASLGKGLGPWQCPSLCRRWSPSRFLAPIWLAVGSLLAERFFPIRPMSGCYAAAV